MSRCRQYKPRQIAYDVDVIVSYVPFPSEKARDEAYDTHVKLFLRAKEREFMDRLKDKIPDESRRMRIAKELVEKLIENLLYLENYHKK